MTPLETITKEADKYGATVHWDSDDKEDVIQVDAPMGFIWKVNYGSSLFQSGDEMPLNWHSIIFLCGRMSHGLIRDTVAKAK